MAQHKFLTSALSEGIRLDGREIEEHRHIEISFGSQFGQAEVHIGSSYAIATVEAEIEAPSIARPSEGFFYFNVDLNFILPPKSEYGRRKCKDEALKLSSIIEKLLVSSSALDKESLCIVNGKQVWCLRCDIRVLNDDGNLTDLCSLAALVAIQHFKRQEVKIEGDSVRVLSYEESDLTPVSVHHFPVFVTFAFLPNTDIFVVDPSQCEEEVGTSRLSIAVNQHGEICGVHKAGGVPIDMTVLRHIIQVAARRSSDIIEVLNAALLREAERQQLLRRNLQKMYEGGAVLGITDENLLKSVAVNFETDNFEIPIIDPLINSCGMAFPNNNSLNGNSWDTRKDELCQMTKKDLFHGSSIIAGTNITHAVEVIEVDKWDFSDDCEIIGETVTNTNMDEATSDRTGQEGDITRAANVTGGIGGVTNIVDVVTGGSNADEVELLDFSEAIKVKNKKQKHKKRKKSIG